MDRREFIKTVGGLVLLSGATPWPEVLAQTTRASAGGGGPFNVLFMTADDMNGHMPGWMGNPLKPTPNMDAFATTAHKFTRNHDAAPICQPSREAMLTGLWPNRSGALGFNPINEGVPTLATVLKAKGYFVAAFNKLEHMKPASCFPWDYSSNDSGRNPPKIEEQVGEAIKRAGGKPWLIVCNSRDPHRPWPGLNGRGGGGGGGGGGRRRAGGAAAGGGGGGGANAAGGGGGGEGEEAGGEGAAIDDVTNKVTAEKVLVPSFMEDLPPVREELAHYYNAVQRLDMAFGKAMAALQASGQMDRTIVVFVSDHGMPFPLAKCTCYHNGHWCPTTIRWPGMGEPKVFEQMTQSIDIMPTLLDLLGVSRKPDMDGRSWVPLIKGEPQGDRDYIINNVNGVANGNHFPARVVQTEKAAFMATLWSNGTNRLHGIDSMGGLTLRAMEKAGETDAKIKKRVDQYVVGYPMAFYDLANDPDQRENVIGDPAHAAEVKRLQTILMDYMVRTKDPQLANYRKLLAGEKVEVQVEQGNRGRRGERPAGP